MGNELKCRARFGKQQCEGKALLETSEIIFRGDFRLKIPFTTIQSIKVTQGNLELKTADGLAVFELGPAAEKWREKILHPKSRIEKLGVKNGAKVALIGFGNPGDNFLSELDDRTKAVSYDKVQPDTEWIFLKAETLKGLAQLGKIAKAMRGATALWIVYPKGQLKITESDVLDAGRAAGLKDIKVVGFSVTHTALKFVIPISQR